MQIRKQLRANALTFLQHPLEVLGCCLDRTCIDGYHGKHTRVRFKARSRHHGNEPGQSKQGVGR